MMKFKCDFCDRNMLEFKLNNYPVIYNNELKNMCNDCFDKLTNITRTIFINISVISNDHILFFHKINYKYLLKYYSDYNYLDQLLDYNDLSDLKIKKDLFKKINKFYGGKKLICLKLGIDDFIDFDIFVEYIDTKTKCAICKKKLDSVNYFIKDNTNQIVPICDNCQIKLYGVYKEK